MNEEKVRPLGQLWSLSLFAYTVIQKHLMLAEAQDGVSYLQLASLQQIDSQINEGQIPCWLCNVDMGYGFSGEGQYNEAFFITRSVQEGSGQFVKKEEHCLILWFYHFCFTTKQSLLLCKTRGIHRLHNHHYPLLVLVFYFYCAPFKSNIKVWDLYLHGETTWNFSVVMTSPPIIGIT